VSTPARGCAELENIKQLQTAEAMFIQFGKEHAATFSQVLDQVRNLPLKKQRLLQGMTSGPFTVGPLIQDLTWLEDEDHIPPDPPRYHPIEECIDYLHSDLTFQYCKI
jgi:hypothetical protein